MSNYKILKQAQEDYERAHARYLKKGGAYNQGAESYNAQVDKYNADVAAFNEKPYVVELGASDPNFQSQYLGDNVFTKLSDGTYMPIVNITGDNPGDYVETPNVLGTRVYRDASGNWAAAPAPGAAPAEFTGVTPAAPNAPRYTQRDIRTLSNPELNAAEATRSIAMGVAPNVSMANAPSKNSPFEGVSQSSDKGILQRVLSGELK